MAPNIPAPLAPTDLSSAGVFLRHLHKLRGPSPASPAKG